MTMENKETYEDEMIEYVLKKGWKIKIINRDDEGQVNGVFIAPLNKEEIDKFLVIIKDKTKDIEF